MQDEHISDAIKQALTDKDKTVRIVGIDLIENEYTQRPDGVPCCRV